MPYLIPPAKPKVLSGATPLSVIRRALGMQPNSAEAGLDQLELTALAFDQGAYGLLLLDHQGRVLIVNATLMSWLGYSESEELSESSLKSALGMHIPTTWALVMDTINSVALELIPPQFEIRLARSDGFSMRLQASASAVRSSSGAFIACALSLVDVSESSRRMRQLTDSSDRMQSVTDTMTVCQAYFDSSLVCLFVNRAFCEYVGTSRENLVGRSFHRCLRSEDARELSPGVALALGAKRQTTLMERCTPDGGTRFLVCRLLPDTTPDGVVRGVFIEIDDVTEHGRAQEQVLQANIRLEARLARTAAELERTKLHFRKVLNSWPDAGFFFLDPEGRIFEWSESAERLHGFSGDMARGRHFDDLDATLGTNEQVSPTIDSIQLAGERGQWVSRGWRQRADGKKFWAQTLITAISGEGGEIEGFSCMTRDMTAAKDLDEVMDDLNGELERRVAERIRERVGSSHCANPSPDDRTRGS